MSSFSSLTVRPSGCRRIQQMYQSQFLGSSIAPESLLIAAKILPPQLLWGHSETPERGHPSLDSPILFLVVTRSLVIAGAASFLSAPGHMPGPLDSYGRSEDTLRPRNRSVISDSFC